MHYYFSDHLGSHAAIQSGDGSTCEHDVDYYPYGGIEQDYCGGPLQNYKFTGKERDSESGLDNFKARYYASSLARMQAPDPLGIAAATLTNPQSLNLYAYASDNPLRYIDPTGMQAVALNNGFLQGSTKLKCTYQGDVCQDQAGDPKQAQNNNQKTSDTVTVNAYEGAHGFGHVGVGVDSNKTEGLYPAHEETAKEKAEIVAGKDVPGAVHEDTAKKTDTVTIHVTGKQADAVRKYVSGAEPPNSGTYNLYGRNCARFVEGALKSAGVKSTDTMYPHDLMKDLHTRYDHDDQ